MLQGHGQSTGNNQSNHINIHIIKLLIYCSIVQLLLEKLIINNLPSGSSKDYFTIFVHHPLHTTIQVARGPGKDFPRKCLVTAGINLKLKNGLV